MRKVVSYCKRHLAQGKASSDCPLSLSGADLALNRVQDEGVQEQGRAGADKVDPFPPQLGPRPSQVLIATALASITMSCVSLRLPLNAD